MSYIVARMQKMKAGNMGGAFKHNERVFEQHANKDIDPERSHLNYELTNRDRSMTYDKQIKDYLAENRTSKRAVRKDAVLCDEWIITSDKAFFDKLTPEQTRDFFVTAKNYFAENYGTDNVVYASVHLDEKTPHMHMGIVPLREGKLSSKDMFNRQELKLIQDELPKYMQERGFDLERGRENSEAKHKTVAEFKRDLADKEFKQELIEKFNAPLFINEKTGEFSSDVEAYLESQQIAELFDISLTLRETTEKEKMDWIKNQFQEEIEKLQNAQRPLKDDLSDLISQHDKMSEELKQMAHRASESFSELSELSEAVEILKNNKKELSLDVEKGKKQLEQVKNTLKDKVATYNDLEGRISRLKPAETADVEEVRKIHDELSNVKKGPLGGLHVTQEFLERLKSLVYKFYVRINELVRQNTLLRDKLNDEAWKNKTLEGRISSISSQNQRLKQELSEMREYKWAFEDVQSVLSDKEIVSINQRLEQKAELEARQSPPAKDKGRSI